MTPDTLSPVQLVEQWNALPAELRSILSEIRTSRQHRLALQSCETLMRRSIAGKLSAQERELYRLLVTRIEAFEAGQELKLRASGPMMLRWANLRLGYPQGGRRGRVSRAQAVALGKRLHLSPGVFVGRGG